MTNERLRLTHNHLSRLIFTIKTTAADNQEYTMDSFSYQKLMQVEVLPL